MEERDDGGLIHIQKFFFQISTRRYNKCQIKRIARIKAKISMNRMLFIFLLSILINVGSAQFGEIASIVTGLLGSGGGLAGLAGTGAGLAGTAGGLAGSGAAASSGAASALSGIGPLYQLAQAALQLTGTGVGIANQASESAWFPVAVENAARMNRDFQDRLLKGGTVGPPGSSTEAGLGAVGGFGRTSKTSGNKISKEYGKNFESGETETTDYDGSEVTDAPSRRTSRLTLPPPSLFGGENGGENEVFPSPSKLPGLVSLLPGESAASSVRGREASNGGNKDELDRRNPSSSGIGIDSVEPVGPDALKPLSGYEFVELGKSTSRLGSNIGKSTELVNRPKIQIELPSDIQKLVHKTSSFGTLSPSDQDGVQINFDYNEGRNGKGNFEQPNLDFSIDDNNAGQNSAFDKNEDKELLTAIGSLSRSKTILPMHRTSPPRAASPNENPTVDTNTEAAMQAAKAMAELIAEEFEKEKKIPHMVPELQKLISALRNSNLSRDEFIEIAKQLKISNNPRENTTPAPEYTTEREELAKTEGGGKTLIIVNEKRNRATMRNLEALHSALETQQTAETDAFNDPVLRNVETSGGHSSPIVLTLPRHPNPALITSNMSHPEALMRRAKAHAVIPYPRRIVSEMGTSSSLHNSTTVTNFEKENVNNGKQTLTAITGYGDRPIRVTGATGSNMITRAENTITAVLAENSQISASQQALTQGSSPNHQQPQSATQAQLQTQTKSSFQQQQPSDIIQQRQQQQYNEAYRNYINYYYPQYAQYYGTQNVGYGQSNNYQQSAQAYNPQQPYYQPQQQNQPQWNYQQQQQNQAANFAARNIPARTISNSIPTTPPSALQHPFSQGALLTLMQPNVFSWQSGR